jgi:hypothetical protein
MCGACFLEGIYRFPSAHAFEVFEKDLLGKQPQLHTQVLSALSQNPLLISSPVGYYRCDVCQELWALSIPDNAWRGYFLPKDEALSYQEKLNHQDKSKRLGCIAFIIGVLFFILWKVYFS